MSKHNLVFSSLQHLKWEKGYPETLLLFRCACGCGRTKTEIVKGIWSAEQLGVKGG